MKKNIVLMFVGASILFLPTMGSAGWQPLSGSLPEGSLRWVGVDPSAPHILYVASDRYLFRSEDNGSSWSQVFMLRGANHWIQTVWIDPSDSRKVYVGSSAGIWKSENGSKTWKYFFRGLGGDSKNIYSITASNASGGDLWLGTASGILSIDPDSGSAYKIPDSPNRLIYSLLDEENESGRRLWALAPDGIYESQDAGAHWKKTASEHPQDLGENNLRLERGGSEEMDPIQFSAASMTYHKASEKVLSSQSIGLGRPFRSLTQARNLIYAAGDRGVFEWDPKSESFKDISQGLPSIKAAMVSYDPQGDRLLVATKAGVFEFSFSTPTEGMTSIPITSSEVQGVLRQFKNEPSISEIQNAAVEYAEVHPRKIQEWRKAAARSAWLPSISFNKKRSDNQTIDIDRGGTADADRFIQGPEEFQDDWAINMSWNLSELVWNNDQTSIDVRSKLMAELRDDIVSEVTHLFYQRRRLQAEFILNPPKNTKTLVEKSIQFEELTASIDGLTGGYLSGRLADSNSLDPISR